MADENGTSAELARVRARLAGLDLERRHLLEELAALETQLAPKSAALINHPSFENAPVTNNSASGEKIDLFRRLFAGRPDVFPTRWENRKTGRVRRRMIWNIRGDFGAEVIGSSGLGYAALR